MRTYQKEKHMVMYAIEIRKSDLGLIQLLNDGGDVKVEKKKTYFIFEVSDDGKSITTDIMSERETFQKYEISGRSPLLLRLKK
jgi:hypothetical protein